VSNSGFLEKLGASFYYRKTSLIEDPGCLFFDPKILEIFTLVPPYMILLKWGRLSEVLRYINRVSNSEFFHFLENLIYLEALF
jgi:hypothetical protein